MMNKTHDQYPGGSCKLPLICSNCGIIITEENVINDECENECEVCDYCSTRKCPSCKDHVCCGGCI